MSGWGINPNAPKHEKIKSEMNDYLMGQNSCGVISYKTYSEMYDFTMNLLDRMYAQGLVDGEKIAKEVRCKIIMNNDFMLYGVIDKSTGKLVSDITNPRRKYWDRKVNAEKAINKYGAYYHNNHHNPSDLELVEIECKVKESD